MRANPEYLARNAATTAGGFSSPVTLADDRRSCAVFLRPLHGKPYGRAVRETRKGLPVPTTGLLTRTVPPTRLAAGKRKTQPLSWRFAMTAPSRRTRAKTKPTQETDLAELGRITFDSVLTDEQVEEFEKAQTEWGPKRRCALITLARTRQQLVDGFGSGDGPDVLLEMIGHVSDYEKHCKALAELAATAVARLMAVAAATIEKGATA